MPFLSSEILCTLSTCESEFIIIVTVPFLLEAKHKVLRIALQVQQAGWLQAGKCTICRQTHELNDYGHKVASREGDIMPCPSADKYLYVFL